MKLRPILYALIAIAGASANAETFRIVKGIAVTVNMPKVHLTKNMFLTSDDQLLTVTCSIPLSFWSWSPSQILYVDVARTSNQMVIGTQFTGDRAPHSISTDKISSFEECQKTIAILMEATMTSPITFSIEADGPIRIER